MKILPQAKRRRPCGFCGSATVRDVSCGRPQHSRSDCVACGRSQGFNPAPWTMGRCQNFKMPCGKHFGEGVGEIASAEDGRIYLAWATEKIEGNVGTAATIMLGLIGPGEAWS
jgi:hypothetical protein